MNQATDALPQKPRGLPPKLCIVVGAAVLFGCPPRPTAPAPPRRVVDTHVHFGPSDIDRLHQILDEVGIDWVVNLSGTWPGALLEAQLAVAQSSGRVLVACNLPWRAAVRSDFPDIAVRLLQQAKAQGAVALKIEKMLGLAAIGPQGQLLRVDDPWLDRIWQQAGALKLPVVIHTGDPKAFWLPIDEHNERKAELLAHPSWSNYGRPVPSFESLLTQLMRVVARHPKTTFVSVHFGNNAEDPYWVAKQLEKFDNLYVDIAARIPELGRHDPRRLRRVFIDHHRRILFGSDLGLGSRGFLMLGSVGDTPSQSSDVGPFFAAHWRWLETAVRSMPNPTPIQGDWTLDGLELPRHVLEAIYRGNAVRLFGRPDRSRASDAAPETRRSPPR
ncbi:MAG: amidohydrolase family protein [Myxococcota bacterium]